MAQLAQEIDNKIARGIGNYSLINDASETGTSKVLDSVNDMQSGKVKNSLYDQLVASGKDKEIAALTATMFTEQKAATDLTASLAVRLEEQSASLFNEAFNSLKSGQKITNNSQVIKDLKSKGFISSSSLSDYKEADIS